MKRIVGLTMAICVAVLLSGCATAPVGVRAVPVGNNGAGVGVVAGADAQDGFWAQNWGKVLTGAVAAGGLYMVADHNGWLEGGEREKVEVPSTPSVAGMGDGNVIVGGTIGGDVNISYGNTAPAE